MRNLIPFLVFLSLFSWSASAAEDYYVWVDENGVTNYAQRNPQDYDANLVSRTHRFGESFAEEKQSSPSDSPDSASKTTGSNEVDPDAVIAQEREALAAKIASQKKSNCNIGKKNLVRLEAFGRIRVSDDKGENRIISDEEKAAKINEARQVIRENCTG